jgi:hypothetical protein
VLAFLQWYDLPLGLLHDAALLFFPFTGSPTDVTLQENGAAATVWVV